MINKIPQRLNLEASVNQVPHFQTIARHVGLSEVKTFLPFYSFLVFNFHFFPVSLSYRHLLRIFYPVQLLYIA